MHALELAILEAFKQHPAEALTTSEIVRNAFPQEQGETERLLSSPDKQYQRRGKRRKARLHRKLLYHLNKLVDDQLLTITGVRSHGEKLFSLTLREGEVEIRSGKKRITIHKPSHVTTPIDTMVGLITPYRREDWLNRVNAILLEGQRFETLAEAGEAIDRMLNHVNDTVGLLGTETLIDAKTAEIEEFLTQLERTTRDYQRRVTLILSVALAEDESKLIRFIKTFCAFCPSTVELILEISPKDLHERRELFTTIIPGFVKSEMKLHLKNNAIHPAPVLFGNAGPYAIGVDEWRAYRQRRATSAGLCLAGASITIDLARLKGERTHELARKVAEALFLVGTQRRRSFEHAFGLLTKEGITFTFADEYLRFWNYDSESETLVGELEAAREVLDGFCAVQERVYRACGMPIRFRIQMSSGFGKYGDLSPRQYQKMNVQGISTLQSEPFEAALRQRERLCRVFSVDRVRFFRREDDAEKVLRELTHLMTTYAFPSITYDFSELRGDLKLTAFLGGDA